MPSARRTSDQRYDAEVNRAVELHGSGRLGEAEILYRRLLSHPRAQTATLHFVLGLLLAQDGQVQTALAEYDLAAGHGHRSADLYERRADLLRLSGRFEDAVVDYDQALALRPDHAPALHHRAVALAALGRYAEALEDYDRASILQPQDASILNNRGVALEQWGRPEDALACYDRAIAIDGGYGFAHHNRGSALLKLEQFDAAAASLRRALTMPPQRAESWNLLGIALGGLSAHHEALIAFDQAIALKPVYAEALNNQSVALRWVGRFEDAVVSASRALEIDPRLASAWISRGAASARLNRYGEAIQDYDAALALAPGSAPAALSRGLAREALGDLDGALADFAQADSWAPAVPDAKICMGLTHIRRGAFERGFDLYQWRWRKSSGPALPHPEATLWTGEQPIVGRTILLHAEQGYGDVIQFCRFAADVAALGARVLLQVQPALMRLAQTLMGPEAVFSLDRPAPPFDLHAPLMNLPAALSLSLQTLGGRSAYLSAPTPLENAWSDRLGERDRPRVGLAWTGNPFHENDYNRSAPFEALSPLFETRARFVSLQKVHRPEDLPRMDAASALQRFGGEYGDFADVAAVIQNCDAVVSVDTAVAHLAGAMGKRVFILLPRFADWRWMDGRADTPWYLSASLLRQTSFGDWSAPVVAAAAAVNAL
jgi:tetratricopeptide (TPR) repeat protein